MDPGTRIETLGWRQGSFLPPTLIALATGPDGKAAPPDDLYLVVTQSCDLVHAKIQGEPWCEALRLRRVPRLDGTFQHGRNGRKIHVQVLENGAPLAAEGQAFDRFFLPREKLAEHPPAPSFMLRELTLVVDWLGRRYSRPAFPHSFNTRVASQQSAIKTFLEKNHFLLRSLYIRLSSFDDMPADQSYRLKLLLVAPSELWKTREADARALAKELSEILVACSPKLEVVEALPMSDDRVSLALLDAYVPWQIFDYLTTRDEAA
jgi:hypothetical protein